MSKKTISYLILIALALIWGSSFILIKKSLYAADNTMRLSPQQLGALRIFISGTLLLSIVPWKKLNQLKNKLGSLFIAGLIGTGFPAFLFAFAQQEVSSSLAGMLNASVPIITVIIAYVFYDSKITKFQFLGLVIASLGIFAIADKSGFNGGDFLWWSFILLMLGNLSYALNLNFIKFNLKEIESRAISSISISFLSPLGLGYLIYDDFFIKIKTQPNLLDGILPIIILSVFGTAIAVILLNYLIKIASPLFASTVTYLIPIVAMFIGFADGETIQLFQLLGMSLLLVGVFLINKRS